MDSFLKHLITRRCVAMFANSVALANPFPYAGFMVLHYGMTADETEVGFYAGWIMTARGPR